MLAMNIPLKGPPTEELILLQKVRRAATVFLNTDSRENRNALAELTREYYLKFQKANPPITDPGEET
jgi:hypothetical protein